MHGWPGRDRERVLRHLAQRVEKLGMRLLATAQAA